MSTSARHTTGLRRATGLAALLTATVLTVTACGSDDDSTTFRKTTGATDGTASPVDGDAGDGDAAAAKADRLMHLYGGVLDDLDLADFRDPDVTAGDLTGDFEYAVSDLDADKTPELLIQAKGTEFSAVRVYGATEDATKTVTPAKIFHAGAAGAGGSRMNVMSTTDNSGLLATSGQAGNGQTETVLWTFDGSEMAESGQNWNYRIDQVPSDLSSREQKIDWTPAGDLSGLDALGEGTSAVGAGGDDGPQPTTAGDAGDAGDTGNSGASASSGGTLPQSATAPDSQIGGTCGTVDGATVTAGSATSCGFAMAVAQQALQPGTWGPGVAPDPTVTAPWGSTTVTATSPSTGETYTMSCSSGTDSFYAHCSGGNGAEVRFEKRGQGGLMGLLG